MVYGCGCAMFGTPSCFKTSVEMRFFWLPLSTRNCIGEPFTHICDWKRCSPSSGSFGPSFSILVVAKMALGSASMIYFPFSLPLSSSNSGSENASDSSAFSSTTKDCLARHSWGCYEIHTTSLCPSLDLWCCSESHCFGLAPCSLVWGHLFESQIQSLASSA